MHRMNRWQYWRCPLCAELWPGWTHNCNATTLPGNTFSAATATTGSEQP